MDTPRTLKSADDLVAAGLLNESRRNEAARVGERYAIAVTPTIAALIDRTNSADPIALQFIPQTEELVTRPEEREDPIGDHAHSPVKGIVHRYPDRVLLKAVHVCPVYCRFCFRREMVGPDGDGTLSGEDFEAALAYIASHDEIWEVILTGGDPLVLSPRRLAEIMRALAAIKHVRIVRFHTRVPVATPQAINDELIAALKDGEKTVWIALHANHPKELTKEARDACARLIDAGIAMVSQTVLLKGINDDPAVLGALMRGFVETRIKPYYLHHPDLAPGTGHFRMDIAEGQAIVAALRGQYSGLCQPTYVLDIPGGHGKTPLGAATAQSIGEGCWSVSDYRGERHIWP